MSFFDHRYYALTKANMARIGLWPEQSKYVRIILPSMMFAITLTLVGPGLIRLHDAWGDISILARSTTILLMGIAMYFFVFNSIHNAYKVELSFKYIEKHWEMLKNTPAAIVLDKCAQRGGYITVIYSICLYAAMTIYFCLCLSPIILDLIDPVNESRPKVYVVEAEYGIALDKYYWLILAHAYIVAAIGINITVAIGTVYIVWTVHACALFEALEAESSDIEDNISGVLYCRRQWPSSGVNPANLMTLALFVPDELVHIRFNLELIAYENPINIRSDWNYKKIRDCIILHIEAISFADLVEDTCCTSTGVALGISMIISVIAGVQALINLNHPEVLIQQATVITVLVFHLFVASIPGQELMNHSGKIYTTAYNLDWQDMPMNAQKLLIPILLRSSKPCHLSAGKVYVMSMETFSSAIRAVLSYFMIFAQMI